MSNRPTAMFWSSLFTVLSACVGHKQTAVDFASSPLLVSNRGDLSTEEMWARFKTHAEATQDMVHPSAEQAAGKHGFTAGTHAINCNVLVSSLRVLQQNRESLLQFYEGGPAVEELQRAPLGAHWFEFGEEALLTTPAHFTLMTNGVATIFHEMCLHPRDRA